MDPITIALLGSAISAGGSALGGYFSNKGKKETRTQKQQRNLVDDLIRSLKGGGSYSNMFNVDEAGFQKSFVDPAKNLFKNQIAPQIQQQYIESGQQRGTGLDDTLTRAGVNLDDMLNQYYFQAQENAMGRKQNAIGNILGQGAGAPNQVSGLQAAGQGLAGYGAGGGFGQDIGSILRSLRPDQSIQDTYQPQRKGFEAEPQYYNPYTGSMS